MARLRNLKIACYINNNPILIYLRLARNYKIICQLCYKQNSNAFDMGSNSKYRINGVNNKFSNFIIKPLYQFAFYQVLWFYFKNLANYFHKLFINKTISDVISIS